VAEDIKFIVKKMILILFFILFLSSCKGGDMSDNELFDVTMGIIVDENNIGIVDNSIILDEKSFMRNEVIIDNVVEIEDCSIYDNRIKIKFRNLSEDKTIAGYGLIIKYVNENGEYVGKQFEFGADKCITPPNEMHEVEWDFTLLRREADIFIKYIGFMDGTEWINSEPPE
jgi:hypothetical protein